MTRQHLDVTPQIADTVDDLTPGWFTSALRAGGAIESGDDVLSARVTVIGTGQVGFVARAELTYSGGGGPDNVIVKLPSADPGSRQMGSALGLYESEVRFYQQIAPQLQDATPTVHWCSVEPATGHFTVLMEDLSATATVGDMVGGCTTAQAQLAVGVLPQLQAGLWDSPALADLAWAGIAKTEMLFGAVGPAIEPFTERFAERVDPEHLALAQRLAPCAAGSAQRLWEPPFVIAHGDYRLDNLMFGSTPAARPITVIDWQAARIAPPLLDVTTFMGSCLSVEQRRREQNALLHHYHDGLRSAGIEDFSFEQVVDSFRRCSLYPFLLTIAVCVTLERTERGDQMWAQMFANSAAIVQDTDAAALLL